MTLKVSLVFLSAADAACYAAKNKGRNRVHIYQADDQELAIQHGEMQWVARLTQALEENRFLSLLPVYCPDQSNFRLRGTLRSPSKAG